MLKLRRHSVVRPVTVLARDGSSSGDGSRSCVAAACLGVDGSSRGFDARQFTGERYGGMHSTRFTQPANQAAVAAPLTNKSIATQRISNGPLETKGYASPLFLWHG
jgi:hypothetical protein